MAAPRPQPAEEELVAGGDPGRDREHPPHRVVGGLETEPGGGVHRRRTYLLRAKPLVRAVCDGCRSRPGMAVTPPGLTRGHGTSAHPPRHAAGVADRRSHPRGGPSGRRRGPGHPRGRHRGPALRRGRRGRPRAPVPRPLRRLSPRRSSDRPPLASPPSWESSRGASWGCSPAAWPAGPSGAPKRGCLATIAIGILGALLAGAASKLATGDELDTFDELDLGSVFVAFIGAAALLLVLEAASGRQALDAPDRLPACLMS